MADGKTQDTASKADAPAKAETAAAKTAEAPKAVEKAADAAPKAAEKVAPAPAKEAAKAAARTAAAPAKAAAATGKTRRTAKKKPARAKAASARRAPAKKNAAPKRTAAAAAAKTTTSINEGTRTMKKEANQAAEQFRAVFGDVNERAKGAMERNARIVEELTDLTRGNVEALVASSKAAAKGVEALSQDAAEYGRKSFEEASATLKSFAEVKSATDFFRLQSDYARSAFDSAVAESARLSETVLKLAGEVAEPITSRYTVAAERVKTLAA